MTTPTTPYALFRFVPLSECRGLWRSYGRPHHYRPLFNVARQRWRQHTAERYVERLTAQLAAVTAERDETQRALDGALDNMEHVTAERDAAAKLVKAATALHVDLQAKLRNVTAERDALRRELANMTGEL